MTDAVFEYEASRLMSKRPTAIRERQLRNLEFEAFFEEVADAIVITSDEIPVASKHYRFCRGFLAERHQKGFV